MCRRGRELLGVSLLLLSEIFREFVCRFRVISEVAFFALRKLMKFFHFEYLHFIFASRETWKICLAEFGRVSSAEKLKIFLFSLEKSWFHRLCIRLWCFISQISQQLRRQKLVPFFRPLFIRVHACYFYEHDAPRYLSLRDLQLTI